MRMYWFRVHYPNGVHMIQAFSNRQAEMLALERWGTFPAHVEKIKDSEVS